MESGFSPDDMVSYKTFGKWKDAKVVTIDARSPRPLVIEDVESGRQMQATTEEVI